MPGEGGCPAAHFQLIICNSFKSQGHVDLLICAQLDNWLRCLETWFWAIAVNQNGKVVLETKTQGRLSQRSFLSLNLKLISNASRVVSTGGWAAFDTWVGMVMNNWALSR